MCKTINKVEYLLYGLHQRADRLIQRDPKTIKEPLTHFERVNRLWQWIIDLKMRKWVPK